MGKVTFPDITRPATTKEFGYTKYNNNNNNETYTTINTLNKGK